MATIGVIAGDGVGPEVVEQALAVLGDVSGLDGQSFQLVGFDLGGERYLNSGEVLPDSALDDLRKCDAIFLGAVGHPDVPPGVLEKGILLKLRFAFHQYVNLRPVKLFPGIEGPVRGKGPDDVDMVVVRENNEDLYVGRRRVPPQGDARGGRDPDLDPALGPASSAACAHAASTSPRSRGKARPFRGLSAQDREKGSWGS